MCVCVCNPFYPQTFHPKPVYCEASFSFVVEKAYRRRITLAEHLRQSIDHHGTAAAAAKHTHTHSFNSKIERLIGVQKGKKGERARERAAQNKAQLELFLSLSLFLKCALANSPNTQTTHTVCLI